MKKLLSILLLCCSVVAYSQRNKPIDRLSQRMIDAYEKEDTGSNLFRNIGIAALTAFDPPSSPFIEAWKEQEQLYPEMPMWSMIYQLTDTVFNRLSIYLLNKSKNENAKYTEILQVYQSGICPCITSKLPAKEPWKNYVKVLNKCDDSLRKDQKYWKKFTDLVVKVPSAERTRLGNLMEQYIFLRCAALNKAGYDYAKKLVADHQDELVYTLGEYLFRWPAYYYDSKQTDSLSRLFPTYKKFEADIKTAVSMDTVSYIVSEGPIPYSDKQGSKLLTFYSVKWGGIDIRGQLQCTYASSLPIVITGYTFIPASKVKNAEQLKKKIEKDNIQQLLKMPLDDDF
ncbi:MAG TPA: hypothetical protein VHM26_17745 [Chitinophagaceae bacterium]|jgi:hypothetical protein|nr:hypothetical protein [Chitinophagaceae bacterium]